MAKSSQFQPSLMNDVICTILNGNHISEIVDTKNTSLMGLTLPSNFNGDRLAFQVSTNATDFFNLKDKNNNNIVIDISKSSSFSFGRDDFLAWNYIKIISDKDQKSDVTIDLQTRAGG